MAGQHSFTPVQYELCSCGVTTSVGVGAVHTLHGCMRWEGRGWGGGVGDSSVGSQSHDRKLAVAPSGRIFFSTRVS